MLFRGQHMDTCCASGADVQNSLPPLAIDRECRAVLLFQGVNSLKDSWSVC